MNQAQLSIIIIDPPLPCGIVKPSGPCGKPAAKGRIRPIPQSAGKWEITPVCRDCSLAAMSIFWGGAEQQPPPDNKPTPEPEPVSRPSSEAVSILNRQRESNSRRYVAQFMSQSTDEFEDFAYWSSEKQAIGHVLMTVGSNPRVKAGRVFDQVEQRVIGDVHYKS